MVTTGDTTDATTGETACIDRSLYCVAAPGQGSGTAGDDSTGPSGCAGLEDSLTSAAEPFCASGFSPVGVAEHVGFSGDDTVCCLEYKCDAHPQVCRPLAELDSCDNDGLGAAVAAAEGVCGGILGQTPLPSVQGEHCCGDFDCYCGPSGG